MVFVCAKGARAALLLFCLVGAPWLTASAQTLSEDDLIRKTFDLTMQGRAFVDSGNFAEAERLFREVLEMQRQAATPSPLSVASALHNLAAVVARQGRIAEAEPMARDALAMREANSALDNALVQSWQLLASILKDSGRLAEAEEMAAKAVERTLNGSDVDRTDLIRNAATLAALQAENGDLGSAKQLLGQLTPMLPDLSAYDRAQVLNVAGRIASLGGETANAETFYREALSQAAGLPRTKDWTAQDDATLLNNLGALLSQQGRLADAEGLFEDGARVLSEAGLGQTPLAATIFDGLGEVYRGQFLFQEAFDTQRKALDIRLAIFQSPHAEIGVSFSNIGLTLLRAGQTEYAVASLEKAVAIQRATGDILRLARAESNLATAYFLLGRSQEAIGVSREASVIFEKNRPTGHSDVVTSLFNLAWLQLSAGEAEPARDVARKALDLYKLNTARLGADETIGAAELREKRRQVMAMVAALWETDPVTGIDEAFRSAQWAQSSTAAQVVRRVAARFAAGEGEIADLARRKQDLVNDWRAADRQFLNAVGTSGASNEVSVSLQGRIDTITAEIRTLDDEIGARFPDYARLTQPDVLSVADIQALLEPDEALLMPVTTSDETYVFAMNRDDARWARTPLSEQDLDGKIRALRKDLDPLGAARAAKRLKQPQAVSGPTFDRATAYDLYGKLIAPIADVLDGRGTVLVVKEGALAGLPLSVLVASPPNGADSDPLALRDTDWLVRHHAFATLPSAMSLQTLRRFSNPRQAEAVFAAFGDPDFSGSEETEQPVQIAGYFNRGVADTRAVRSLPPLPGTRREVEGLAKLLGVSDDAIRFGGQATEEAVKNSQLVSKAAIVTFATHGLVAGDLDGLAEPALAFSAPQTPSDLDDGLLTASEAAELDLAADWVILSACNTAAPDGTPGGEGLSGLASAFLYAGARSLLVSHWPVRDDAAALLTQGAIAARAKDAIIGHAESLRRSMLSLLEDPDLPGGSHPSVWAPFVVVGSN